MHQAGCVADSFYQLPTGADARAVQIRPDEYNTRVGRSRQNAEINGSSMMEANAAALYGTANSRLGVHALPVQNSRPVAFLICNLLIQKGLSCVNCG
jgi:hypothetical protein